MRSSLALARSKGPVQSVQYSLSMDLNEESSGVGVGVGSATPEFEDNVYPPYVRVSSIAHPALVPGFIGRREGLSDGSIDPNTTNSHTQMSLFRASSLSPSLASFLANIPSNFVLEAVHQRALQERKRQLPTLQDLGYAHSPAHLARPVQTATGNAVQAEVLAQTASELAAINLLYGGVRGLAYVESLRTFVETTSADWGSQVGRMLKGKLEAAEAVCGYRMLNAHGPMEPLPEHAKRDLDSILTTQTVTDGESILQLNHQILDALSRYQIDDEVLKSAMLRRLESNLRLLLVDCPPEVLQEVDF